jgi:hypothetical protein
MLQLEIDRADGEERCAALGCARLVIFVVLRYARFFVLFFLGDVRECRRVIPTSEVAVGIHVLEYLGGAVADNITELSATAPTSHTLQSKKP